MKVLINYNTKMGVGCEKLPSQKMTVNKRTEAIEKGCAQAGKLHDCYTFTVIFSDSDILHFTPDGRRI